MSFENEIKSVTLGKRSLHLDDLRTAFPFSLIIKQANTKIHINAIMRRRIPYIRGIAELPKEVNEAIMEYLAIDINLVLVMAPSRYYPWDGHDWFLHRFSFNGNKKMAINLARCIEDAIERENNVNHSNLWTPAISPFSGIVMMISRIQTDILAILFDKLS